MLFFGGEWEDGSWWLGVGGSDTELMMVEGGGYLE